MKCSHQNMNYRWSLKFDIIIHNKTRVVLFNGEVQKGDKCLHYCIMKHLVNLRQYCLVIMMGVKDVESMEYKLALYI